LSHRDDVPGSLDNADIELRPDALIYTGDLLREGLELTGPMRAEISLSSDRLDTDVTVKLLDVFPDGRVIVAGTTDLDRARSLCARFVGV